VLVGIGGQRELYRDTDTGAIINVRDYRSWVIEMQRPAHHVQYDGLLILKRVRAVGATPNPESSVEVVHNHKKLFKGPLLSIYEGEQKDEDVRLQRIEEKIDNLIAFQVGGGSTLTLKNMYPGELPFELVRPKDSLVVHTDNLNSKTKIHLETLARPAIRP
jgi:hypothetical protein